jgi:gamma-glutamyltranspeptidase
MSVNAYAQSPSDRTREQAMPRYRGAPDKVARGPAVVVAANRVAAEAGAMILRRRGNAFDAAGAAGGRTIVTNSAAPAIARIVCGKTAAEAIAAPRLQCETIEPATIERSAGAETIEALRRLGHLVKDSAKDAGTAHLIALDGDAWSAAAEPRSADSGAIVA